MKKNYLYMLIITLVIVIAVLLLAIFTDQSWRHYQRGLEEYISAGDRVTVLLAGIDHEKGLDRLFLLVYEPDAPNCLLLSLPPMTVCDQAGEEVVLHTLYQQGGIERVSGALEKFLGTTIPFYLEMENDNFYRLVDFLMGLDVKLDKPLEGTARGISIVVPIDRYRLHSEKVRQFVLYMDTVESPVERLQLLNTLMQSIVRRLRDMKAMLEQPEQWNFQERFYHTNLKRDDQRALVAGITECRDEELQCMRIPGETEVRDGTTLFMARVPEMFQAVSPQGETPVPAVPTTSPRITVAILNGSGTPGVANRIRDTLGRCADIDVVEVGNADNFNYEQTYIISRTASLEPAVRVKEYLSFGIVNADPSLRALVDVTIIIGRDWPTEQP